MKGCIKHIAFLMISFVLLSCIDSINLDLPSSKEKLVVFGWVTNQNGPYEIKLSKTNDFNNTEPYPVLSGATVYLYDRLQNRIDFTEATEAGSYLSSSSFTGVVNESYELHIETMEGNHIVSSREKLKQLPNLVTTFIEFFLNPDQVNVPPEDDNSYLAGLTDDTPDIENYYRWKIYVNDQLRNSPDDLVLFDDKFTDGNVFRFDASNVLFKDTDKITLESWSMSVNAYNYYKQLKNLSGGDITGPAYQFFTLKGNLVDIEKNEEVLGFFGASAVEVIEVQ